MNRVSGCAEFIGEGEAPGRQSLCMMEEQNLTHEPQPDLTFDADRVANVWIVTSVSRNQTRSLSAMIPLPLLPRDGASVKRPLPFARPEGSHRRNDVTTFVRSRDEA